MNADLTRRPQLNGSTHDAKWSTDFVEHLRTVHFSLVILCLGLVIVTISHRDGPTKRAEAELGKIIDISQQLEKGWMTGRCKTDRELWHAFIQDSVKWTSGVSALQDHAINTSDGNYLYSIAGECYLVNSVPDSLENRLVSGVRTDGIVLTRVDRASVYVDRPDTLAQFIALWDLLNSRPEIVIPTTLGDRWVKSDTGSLEIYEARVLDLETRPLRVLDLDIRRPQDSSGRETFIYRSPDSGGYLLVPAFKHTTFSGSDRLRDALGRLQNAPVMQGSFADSFPELSEVARGRESVNFDFLRRSLRVEADRVQESFEVFGLKMPVPETAVWGIVLLVGVQLYFYAHFLELSRRLHSSDPGHDVAWIGVYHGIFPRILFVLSALWLPVGTAVILAFKAQSLFQSSVAGLLLALALVVVVLLALLTRGASLLVQDKGHPPRA